jgi:hypothetical protein
MGMLGIVGINVPGRACKPYEGLFNERGGGSKPFHLGP